MRHLAIIMIIIDDDHDGARRRDHDHDLHGGSDSGRRRKTFSVRAGPALFEKKKPSLERRVNTDYPIEDGETDGFEKDPDDPIEIQ
jgi:hypothetical protein